MKTKIRKLLQIGIIVESVDEAVRNYEMILGAGPWEIKTVSGEDEPFRRRIKTGENLQAGDL